MWTLGFKAFVSCYLLKKESTWTYYNKKNFFITGLHKSPSSSASHRPLFDLSSSRFFGCSAVAYFSGSESKTSGAGSNDTFFLVSSFLGSSFLVSSFLAYSFLLFSGSWSISLIYFASFIFLIIGFGRIAVSSNAIFSFVNYVKVFTAFWHLMRAIPIAKIRMSKTKTTIKRMIVYAELVLWH